MLFTASPEHITVKERALAYLSVFFHILLSLDRHISTPKPDYNFRLILIDLEEQPCICPPSLRVHVIKMYQDGFIRRLKRSYSGSWSGAKTIAQILSLNLKLTSFRFAFG